MLGIIELLQQGIVCDPGNPSEENINEINEMTKYYSSNSFFRLELSPDGTVEAIPRVTANDIALPDQPNRDNHQHVGDGGKHPPHVPKVLVNFIALAGMAAG